MESVIRGLAVGHHRRDHDVHVIGIVHQDPASHTWLNGVEAAGVTVHRVLVHPRRYLRERGLVREVLKRVRPDVVHTHGPRCDVVESGVARSLGIPVVTTLHGSSLLGGRQAILEWLQHRALARFDGVIAVSRRIADGLEKTAVRRDRVHFLPNASVPTVDRLSPENARSELGIPAGTITIGWVARMIPVKACDNFLRAFAMCRELSVRAAIIGDGSERPMLEALAAELGIAQQVTFCGAREQAGRLFPAFDIFAMSSRSEGLPMTLLEAVAAGIPVVATSVGGIPDVVPNPTHALLVPPDDVPALGAAMRQMLEDPPAARRRADAALRRLNEEYGPEVWLDRHEKIYRSIRRIARG
jgi:glycosyltransferase involved in cell wall biosynthesis